MIYYDHYILAQGGIHNITAFAVAFNFIFTPHHTSFGDITLCNFDVFRISVSSSDDFRCRVQHFAYCSAVFFSGFPIPSIRDLTSDTP